MVAAAAGRDSGAIGATEDAVSAPAQRVPAAQGFIVKRVLTADRPRARGRVRRQPAEDGARRRRDEPRPPAERGRPGRVGDEPGWSSEPDREPSGVHEPRDQLEDRGDRAEPQQQPPGREADEPLVPAQDDLAGEQRDGDRDREDVPPLEPEPGEAVDEGVEEGWNDHGSRDRREQNDSLTQRPDEQGDRHQREHERPPGRVHEEGHAVLEPVEDADLLPEHRRELTDAGGHAGSRAQRDREVRAVRPLPHAVRDDGDDERAARAHGGARMPSDGRAHGCDSAERAARREQKREPERPRRAAEREERAARGERDPFGRRPERRSAEANDRRRESECGRDLEPARVQRRADEDHHRRRRDDDAEQREADAPSHSRNNAAEQPGADRRAREAREAVGGPGSCAARAATPGRRYASGKYVPT